MPEYSNPLASDAIQISSTASLAERKMATLAQSKQSKINNIADTDPQSLQEKYDALYGRNTATNDSNYVDQIQASFYRMGRDLGQLGTDVASYGAEKLGAQEASDYLGSIQYKDNDQINEAVGFDPTQHQANLQQVGSNYDRFAEAEGFGQSLDAGLDLAGSALTATPGLLADSSSFMATLPFGGAGVFAKAATVARGAKAGTVAQAFNKLDKVVKINKATTAIGLSMANQQVKEYQAATGEEPSWTRIIGSSVTNVALMGIDLGILKNLATKIPVDFIKDLTLGTAKSIANNGIKGIVKGAKINAGRIAQAFGAEAGQEYLQQWTQILTEQGGDAKDIIADPKNIKETNVAALLGGASAGVTRTVPLAVTGTINTAARGASAAIEKGVDYTGKKVTEAGYKILSQEDRDALNEKYTKDAETYEQTRAANEKAADDISQATNVEELKNLNDPIIKSTIETILDKDGAVEADKKAVANAKSIEELKEVSNFVRGTIVKANRTNKGDVDLTLRELQDKVLESLDNSYAKQDLDANFEKIQNEAIAQYNKINTENKVALEGIRAKDYVYQASSNLYNKSKEYIDKVLPQEVRDEIVKVAEKGIDLTKDGVEILAANVKDLDKSTARALIDDISKGKANDVLYSFSRTQLKAMKKGFKNNPKANKVIQEAINKKSKIKNKIFNDYLTTKKDKNALFKGIINAKGKIISSNVATKLEGLLDITKEVLTDTDTLNNAKTLVDDLTKAKAKNPEAFSKEDQARLHRAKKMVLEALNKNEEGAINSMFRSLHKLYKNYTPKTKKLVKEYMDKVKNAETLKEANNYIKELDAKLEALQEDKTDLVEPEVETTIEEEIVDNQLPDMATVSAEELKSLIDDLTIEGLANIIDIKQLEKNSNPVVKIYIESIKQAKDKLSTSDSEISNESDKEAKDKNAIMQDNFVKNAFKEIECP